MSMLRSFMRYEYRIRKPRILSQNMKAFRDYKREMAEVRKNICRENLQYYDQLQNQYIKEHQENIKKQHFRNQCKFRKNVIQTSFEVYQNMSKIHEKNEEKVQKLQKYVHEEEIKKLNRNRIKKIIEYESEGFWINEKNISQKIKSDVLLPEFVASTQYYHKLFSEAIAYESYDFQSLHKMSSNEDAIKQKNKILIPLFQDIVRLVKKAKDTDQAKIKREYRQKIQKIQKVDDGEEKKEKLKQARVEYDKNMLSLQENLKDEGWKKERVLAKIKDLLILLRQWKEYTNVLSLTSVQVRKMMIKSEDENHIEEQKRELEAEQMQERRAKFVDTIEEDTDDEEISLQRYIKKNRGKEEQNENGLSREGMNLQMLLNEQDEIMEKVDEEKVEVEEVKIPDIKLQGQIEEDIKVIEVKKGFKNEKETTSTIESLKQIYGQDKQISQMLNTVGELTIDYPELFKKVYDKYNY